MMGIGTATAIPLDQIGGLPTELQIDANGLDLNRGSYDVSSVDLSIGSGRSTLNLVRRFSNTPSVDFDIEGYWYYAGPDGSKYMVLKGESLHFNMYGQEDSGHGGYWDGAYHAQDGKTYRFDMSIGDGAQTKFYLTEIKDPDGVSLYIGWNYYCEWTNLGAPDSEYVCAEPRLEYISNNFNYRIKLFYESDSYLTVAWRNVVRATAVNLNAVACGDWGAADCQVSTVDWPTVYYNTTYSGTNVVGLTVTHADSSTESYSVSGSSLQVYANGVLRKTVNYSGDYVSSILNRSVTTNYSYTFGSLGWDVASVTATTNGASKVYVRGGADRVASITDEYNNQTSYIYSGTILSRVQFPEGNYTDYGRDVRGNLTSVTDVAKGGASSILRMQAGYPEAGATICSNPVTCNSPVWVKDALGKQTDYSYDPTHGGVTDIWSPSVPVYGAPDARPHVHINYTSVNGLYTGSVYANGGVIYLPSSSSTCQTAASCAGTSDESWITYEYHGAGINYLPWKTSAGAGGGGAITYTMLGYDYVGNATSTTDALGRQTFAFYDKERRPLGGISEDPDGGGPLPRRATLYQYNADGQVNAVFEGTATGTALSNLTGLNVLRYSAIDYDANGRKVKSKMVDAAGNATSSTEYSYDAVGRPQCTAVRMDPATFGSAPNACAQKSGDPNNPDRITETAFNAAGTLSYLRNGLTVPALYQNTLTYYYTPNMKVAAVVDANGNRTGYEYDGFDRLKKTYYPSPTSPGTSSGTDYEELSYDAASRITSVRRRDGQSTSFSYDDVNRLTGRYYAPGNNNANMLFRYDLLGRMRSAERGNGPYGAYPGYTTSMTASYDALGRKLSEASTYNGSTKTVYSSYDAMSQRNGINIDGLYVTYGYNPTGDLTGVFEGGTASLASFGYDAWGRRINITRPNYTATGWGWDSVSRLACQAQDLVGGGGLACGNPHASPPVLPVASGQDQVTDFAYNPAGQIKSRTAANDAYAWTQAYNVNRSYTSNGLNQYSSITSSATITPTYDARGNLASAGTNSYSYSADNELTGANGMRLDYDMFGRLAYSSGSHTRFLYDGTDLVAEYDDSGNLLRRYVHGPGVDEPLVWYEGSGTGDKRWLHADERGSIVAVTGSAGTALATNSYDPWGIPQTTNLGRFQYTGQTWMPELGLYYYKARFYSATLGRFLQTDPIGYADGPNWYAYVGNDPINATDPSGLLKACTGVQAANGGYVPGTENCEEDDDVWGSVQQYFRERGSSLDRIGDAWDKLIAAKQYARLNNFLSAPGPQKAPPCSLGQKAGQWLGNNITKLGALGTNVGLGTTAAGVVTTGAGIGIGATGNLPVGLGTGFVGLGLIDIGATVTTYSGLVAATGATISAVSGSGKSAVVELASRLSTKIIPSGPIKDFASEAISRGLNAVVPEIQSCTR